MPKRSEALARAVNDAEGAWLRTGAPDDYELMGEAVRRRQATVGSDGLIEHLQRRMHAASGDVVILRRLMLALCGELEKNGDALAKDAMNNMLAQR